MQCAYAPQDGATYLCLLLRLLWTIQMILPDGLHLNDCFKISDKDRIDLDLKTYKVAKHTNSNEELHNCASICDFKIEVL